MDLVIILASAVTGAKTNARNSSADLLDETVADAVGPMSSASCGSAAGVFTAGIVPSSGSAVLNPVITATGAGSRLDDFGEEFAHGPLTPNDILKLIRSQRMAAQHLQLRNIAEKSETSLVVAVIIDEGVYFQEDRYLAAVFVMDEGLRIPFHLIALNGGNVVRLVLPLDKQVGQGTSDQLTASKAGYLTEPAVDHNSK